MIVNRYFFKHRSVTDHLVIKVDEIDKRILEILANYPEGLSYRELWNKLIDENGEHLVAFPTLQRRVDRLKEDGKIEIDKSKWKRGRKMIIKLKEDSREIIKKFSEIRKYKVLFKKYLESHLSALSSENWPIVYITLLKVEKAKEIIKHELDERKTEIIKADMSPELKKNLLFEIIETEVEIEKMSIEAYSKNEMLNRLWLLSEYVGSLPKKDRSEILAKIPLSSKVPEIMEKFIKGAISLGELVESLKSINVIEETKRELKLKGYSDSEITKIIERMKKEGFFDKFVKSSEKRVGILDIALGLERAVETELEELENEAELGRKTK